MPGVIRRCVFPFVCLALLGGCTGQGVSNQRISEAQPVARSAHPTKDTTAPAQRESFEFLGDDGEQDVVTTATGEPAYRIRYKFRLDRPLYYIIENEFLDHGGVPSLLTFTTRVSDRRTLVQRMATVQRPPARSPLRSAPKGLSVRLTWDCDRYEVREKGMKAEVKFDSLRDSYPRLALRGLGGIPGSKVTFDYNRASRSFGDPRVARGTSAGPPTHKKLSRTTQKCDLNKKNLEALFDDLSSLFLPNEPMAVGRTWSASRANSIKNFGESVTDYTFTLREVTQRDGRQIASIDVTGEIHLEKAEGTKRPGATSALTRGPKARKKSKQRDFRIDRALCTGSIEFDVTRGELIRLSLRRQLDLTAELESKDDRKVTLETGSTHVLRVEVQDTPPPQPIIVGGPKAPPPEPVAASKRGAAQRRSAARNRRGSTTRPAAPRKPTPIRGKAQLKPRTPPGKKPASSTAPRARSTARPVQKQRGARPPHRQGKIIGPPAPRHKKPVEIDKRSAKSRGKHLTGTGRGRPSVRSTTQPASRPTQR